VQQLRIWALNVVLSGVVAGSYIMYATTFRRVGQGSLEGGIGSYARFVWAVATDPFFIGGLAMALSGTVMRIVLMRWLGIARTALVSEINLLFTLVLAWLITGSKLRYPNDYVGAGLILAGSWLVSRGT
jgi:drug/metabolite transporter (DMT)-like permease